MEVRRAISSAGPTSQLAYTSQFIVSCAPKAEKHTPPSAALQPLYCGGLVRRLMHSSYFLRQFRHKGIGSLPSAINTACSARITGLPTGAELFGIAQYIAASAKTVSTISTVLFMGEFSEAQISRRAKYMSWAGRCAATTCGYLPTSE